MGVKRAIALGVMAAGCWSMALAAQEQQQPAAQQKPAQGSNPFPEDSNSAPVIPTNPDAAPAASDAIDYSKVALLDPDSDPVRSPDDAVKAAPVTGESSSSSAGMDQLMQPPPDTEKKGKHGRHDDEDTIDQPHKETAAEDESVGAYYLDTKNWKGALSRFESALVLDPENPDVFWGLAESERHMGNLAAAKAHYQTVVNYDPDSKHGKEAKKLLESSELGNVQAATSSGSQSPR